MKSPYVRNLFAFVIITVISVLALLFLIHKILLINLTYPYVFLLKPVQQTIKSIAINVIINVLKVNVIRISNNIMALIKVCNVDLLLAIVLKLNFRDIVNCFYYCVRLLVSVFQRLQLQFDFNFLMNILV